MHGDISAGSHLLQETFSESVSANKYGMWDAASGRNLTSRLLWIPCCADGVGKTPREDYRNISEGKLFPWHQAVFPPSLPGLNSCGLLSSLLLFLFFLFFAICSLLPFPPPETLLLSLASACGVCSAEPRALFLVSSQVFYLLL